MLVHVDVLVHIIYRSGNRWSQMSLILVLDARL